MKIRILGCGGSFGSPIAWDKNGNIDVNNKKNLRLRSSILIENEETTVLVDTSPDLRQQLYQAKCTNVDAVLFTHNHYDHTSGLPDMRAISLINNKIIPAYIPKQYESEILTHYKYIFKGDKNYQPFMNLNILQDNLIINNMEIKTFKHNHGDIDVQTFRINNFAYSTDLKKFYNNDIDKLKNLDLWIVGMLRYDPHPSHCGFNDVLKYIDYLKPKKTIFTHMTPLIDEKEILKKCPPNVFPGYDGLELIV